MKKIISVLLAVMILLNGIGFTIRSKAVAEVLVYGAEALIGVLIGVASSLGGKVVSEMADFDAYDNAYKYAISQGDYIGLVQNDDGSYRFYSKIPIGSDANEDAIKYSEFFADYLNNHMSQSLIESYLDQYAAGNYQNIMKANTYKELKNSATEAFQNYLYAIVKAEEDLENNGELAEVEGLASYNFDFVGPMQGMTLPTKTGYVQAEIDGFKLSTPHKCPTGDIYCPNEQTAYELGATSVTPSANSEKCIGWITSNVFSVGFYVIYNNELYFRVQTGAGKMREYKWNVLPNDSSIRYFQTYSGKKLVDVGCSTLVGLYYGFYYGLSESVGGIPKAKADDLIDTVGGGTLEIDRDDAENLIGRLQDIGILGEDPELGLNENGEIVSADGIDLSTLENLLNQLLDGQVKFEDFEGYLQQITQLLSKSNVNTSSIEHIQNNILAYEADQTRSLDDIKAALISISEYLKNEKNQSDVLSDIQSNVQIIADSLTGSGELTAEKTVDIHTPSSITDKFPFSLPFDIHRIFNLLSADPVAPEWSFEIDMTSVGGNVETINIDLSDYNWLAEIVRWFIFAAAIVGLILATNKLIGRG